MKQAILRSVRWGALVGGLAFTACATHQVYPSGTRVSALRQYEKHFPVTLQKDVVYAHRNGQIALRGDLYRPEGQGPFPGVLVVHGGSWSGRDRSDFSGLSRYLAQRGFVAFNIDYRLAPVDRFPAALQDCKLAIRWMRAHAVEYGIDPRRIAGYGYSAGAHLVAMAALTRPSDGFEEVSRGGIENGLGSELQAAVVGGTAADLTLDPESPAVIEFLGTHWNQDPALFSKASPISYVHAGSPPMFIYYGGADTLVSPVQNTRLADALQRAQVPVEVFRTFWLGHISAFILDEAEREAAISFLQRNLNSL